MSAFTYRVERDADGLLSLVEQRPSGDVVLVGSWGACHTLVELDRWTRLFFGVAALHLPVVAASSIAITLQTCTGLENNTVSQ